MWHAWGEERGVYRFLVGKPKGKRPLGRPRRRWEDNIKLDLRERGIDGANWIRLAQDRVQWRAFVNTVMMQFKSIYWIYFSLPQFQPFGESLLNYFAIITSRVTNIIINNMK
jgi:hypothetical protein